MSYVSYVFTTVRPLHMAFRTRVREPPTPCTRATVEVAGVHAPCPPPAPPMPPLAELHPQVVHFVVAFGLLGIALRVVSVVWAPAVIRQGATALMVAAAIASVPAVQSGHDAHGPAERIPGARAVVQRHESLGERARTWLIAAAVLDVLMLVVASRAEKWRRPAFFASAALAVHAGWLVYEAGEHGGELVYEYAGGVGTQRNDSVEVRRLLVAGLYHQARTARAAGRHDEAARLTDELVRQQPGDATVALLAVESRLVDRRDATGALADLAALPPVTDSTPPNVGARRAVLAAKAHATLGHADSARALLDAAKGRWPTSRALPAAYDSLAAWGAATPAPVVPATTPSGARP